MSVKFTIKNTPPPAEKEGDQVVRFSGVSEPFNRHSERFCRKIGVDGKGNARLVFSTGLALDKVEYYPWYSAEEKEIVKDKIKELLPAIEKFYGKETLEPTNAFFWKDDRSVNLLTLKNESIDVFFDTEKYPAHALLYLSIMAGAFVDLVAPTKSWAQKHQVPHYMALEEESNAYEHENEITKSDAHAGLHDLRKNHGRDALLILAWCMQYETTGFAAYNYNTPEKTLITSHINFIEGKLAQRGRKKNAAKVFLEYYNKWLGQQTRPMTYIEAYVNAGQYFSFLLKRDKKYTTIDGTELGNNVQDVVKELNKQKRIPELERLRELVEAKWKE